MTTSRIASAVRGSPGCLPASAARRGREGLALRLEMATRMRSVTVAERALFTGGERVWIVCLEGLLYVRPLDGGLVLRGGRAIEGFAGGATLSTPYPGVPHVVRFRGPVGDRKAADHKRRHDATAAWLALRGW